MVVADFNVAIQDRAHDDKHSGRVAKQYEQQQVDMQNSKKSESVQNLTDRE